MCTDLFIMGDNIITGFNSLILISGVESQNNKYKRLFLYWNHAT